MYRTTAAMGIIVPEMKSAPQCPHDRAIPVQRLPGSRHSPDEGARPCGQALEMELWPVTRIGATPDSTLVSRETQLCSIYSSPTKNARTASEGTP